MRWHSLLYSTRINSMSSGITDDQTPDLKVDESPISPVERRNSLEKHLQQRPDAQDLKNRHILLDTNAAPYVGSSRSSGIF